MAKKQPTGAVAEEARPLPPPEAPEAETMVAPESLALPEPGIPAWRNRVAANEAEASEVFAILPGSYLAKQMRGKSEITRKELRRKGHDPKRLLRLGVITRATPDPNPEVKVQ